jgi:hypothetical protein
VNPIDRYLDARARRRAARTDAVLVHYGLSDLRIPAAQLRTLEAVVWP